MATSYSEAQKAQIFVALTTNLGNIKKTARTTGLPISTIRRWRDIWEQEGPPDISVLEQAVGDFVSQAERIRDRALLEAENAIPGASLNQLTGLIGMLTDRITVAKGLASKRTETVHTFPQAEEIAATLGAVLQGALSAAQSRERDIIEAEVVREIEAAPESGGDS